MPRFKFEFAPYFRDVVAFAILGLSIATVVSVALMNGEIHQAALYQSFNTQGVTSL